MRKHLIVLAAAALVIITIAAANTLYGHPVNTKTAGTRMEPMAMHYGTMPAQEMSDLTFVFPE